MKIIIFAGGGHQKEWAMKFVAGLNRHGESAEVTNTHVDRPCDLAVFWSAHPTHIINRQRKNNAHFLIMERGYVGDRFEWTSLGFDGLNGRAKFPQVDDGGARWRKHHADKLQDWTHRTTKNAVIMGQVRRDAAVQRVNFLEWAARMNDALLREGYRVFFRPHPREPNLTLPDATLLNGTLHQALALASLVVTYNSNSGVDAMLAGVPTYAADCGSMVYSIAQKNWTIQRPDRTEWAHKIAWCQWNAEEIQNGEAWGALKTVNVCKA